MKTYLKHIRIIYVLLIFILSLILFTFFYKNNFNTTISKFDNKNSLPAINVENSSRVLGAEESNAISIYQRLNTSVVNITFYKTEYISYFFDVYPQTSQGQGSGVIIDPKGYIITNYHVVGEADKVTVTLSQEEGIYKAEIVGVDPENDLAIIKLKNPPKTLNVIPFGTSSDLKIGQKVFAIGNPFGLDRTLTSGIVSGLGRPIKTDNGNVIEEAIQTDASINPGNSGGPLIDSNGRMIGINTMIISPSGGSIGLGFAIPVDKVKDVINEIFKYGYVKRGWIDATFLPMNSHIANALGTSVDYGLMVMTVAVNGEAYKAGLRGGDQKAVYGNSIVYLGGEIIISIDGVKITDYQALARVLKNRKPGEVVKIEYYLNNKLNSTDIKLIDKRKFTGTY